MTSYVVDMTIGYHINGCLGSIYFNIYLFPYILMQNLGIKNIIILHFQYFSKSKLLDFKKNLKALGYEVSGKEERIGSSRNYSAQYFINNTKLE